MEENINRMQSQDELVKAAKKLNKNLFMFLLVFILFASVYTISWIYVNYRKSHMALIAEEKQRLKELITEKKQLRNEINDVFLNTRAMRTNTIKMVCSRKYTKEEELIEQQKNYANVLKTVKIYYPTKLLFGIDVGSTVFSFVKLIDNNSDICVDGDYDLELRKLQWKTNVLIEDSIIKDQSELKKLIDMYS